MSVDMRVKICGITRPEDADLAQELGAWALGFIFYEKSPRFVSVAQVHDIVSSRKAGIVTVGVFVNASLESICETVSSSLVSAIQLHGEETPEFCEELQQRLPGHLLIKAFRPESREDLARVKDYSTICDHILLDHYDEKERGGTGKVGDWELALEAKKMGSVILAGGLSSENVKAAITRVCPYALDVSSMLESSPRTKSEKKMRDFFTAVKT
jgi:phosphoribosylanthranilate isomerase